MDLSVSLRLGRWSQMPETKASTGRKREKEKSKRKGRRNPGKAHGRLVWSSLSSSFFPRLAVARLGVQGQSVSGDCFVVFFSLCNLLLCGSAHMRAASLCDRRIPAFFSLVHSAIFAIDCFFSLPFFHFLFFAAPCLCVGVWSAVARRAQKRKKKKAHTGARRR